MPSGYVNIYETLSRLYYLKQVILPKADYQALHAFLCEQSPWPESSFNKGNMVDGKLVWEYGGSEIVFS